MNEFYQDIVTYKSWELLKLLKKNIDFILIGGWAVYLYAKALKSKDIDIIVDFQMLSQLKKEYDLSKNDRLKKYEAKKDGVDIDIYLPHYSHLGITVEKIIKLQETKETFHVLKKEILLITKLAAYKGRKASIKGQKDIIDIISLLIMPDFNFQFYKTFLTENRLLENLEVLKSILRETREVNELGLNRHVFAKAKKRLLASIQTE